MENRVYKCQIAKVEIMDRDGRSYNQGYIMKGDVDIIGSNSLEELIKLFERVIPIEGENKPRSIIFTNAQPEIHYDLITGETRYINQISAFEMEKFCFNFRSTHLESESK